MWVFLFLAPPPPPSQKRDSGTDDAVGGVRASTVVNLFKDDPRLTPETTTEEVALILVMELTRERKCSLAEWMLRQPAYSNDVKRVADSFVAHAWQYKWSELVSAIAAPELDPDRFIWIDVASVNQHEVGGGAVPKWWFEALHNVILQCKRFEVVLSPWERPIPTDRAWCVWEIYGAVVNRIPVRALMVPTQKEALKTALRGGEVNSNTFVDVFAAINVDKAVSRVPRDRERIMREVRRVGAIKVNSAVMKHIKLWLAGVAREAAEEAEPFTEAHANALNARGGLYLALGEHEDALLWFEEALEVATRVYGGRRHSTVAALLNAIASLMQHKKEYESALPMFEESLAIDAELYGRDHPEVAAKINNLALLMRVQGDYVGAKPLYEEALEIYERCNGRNHPEVALTLGNIAGMLNDQKNFEAAKPLFDESLAIFESVYGRDHPNVATAINNVALLMLSRDPVGSREEAMKLGREACLICERALGPSHPLTHQMRRNWPNVL